MDTISETYRTIRNRACIVCGTTFKAPRAGKLYCSNKCKSFSYYHKEEITQLLQAKKGIDSSEIKINLKEYEAFSAVVKKVNEFQVLSRRKASPYSSFDFTHSDRLKELDTSLPEYAKNLRLRKLSIEEWSFFKILYPDLKREDFVKLVSSFDERFFFNLTHIESGKIASEKQNPVKILFSNHVSKIAEGKIKFI